MGSYQRNPDGSAGQPVGGQPISMSASLTNAVPGSSKLASSTTDKIKVVDPNVYVKNAAKSHRSPTTLPQSGKIHTPPIKSPRGTKLSPKSLNCIHRL